MSAPTFFTRGSGLTAGEVAALTGAVLRPGAERDRRVTGIAALALATPHDLAFFDNGKYAGDAAATVAGVCLTTDHLASAVSARVAVLCVADPFAAFVETSRALFPDALRPSSLFETRGAAPGAIVHPGARMEGGVTIDPGAVIGPGTEIGTGTLIGAGAIVGPGVRIGRHCAIGANATVTHALIGDRVTVHAGCAIGQDGVMRAAGRRFVQVGRVIVQDDVEIGANTAIDRGAFGDTVIGEGTRIGDLVRIARDVSVGRHCALDGQVGLSGAVVVEDEVVLNARVTVADGLTIGAGAVLAAGIAVLDNMPAGAGRGGSPGLSGGTHGQDKDPR